MLWSTPPLKSAGMLRAVWATPERDPIMCLSVVPSTHVAPVKGVWGEEPSHMHTGASFINRRLYPSVASRETPNSPVDANVDETIGLSDKGFVIFGGDDTGSVMRWEVSAASLKGTGMRAVGPQLRPDSFVERRLPRRRIRTSQVTSFYVMFGVCLPSAVAQLCCITSD